MAKDNSKKAEKPKTAPAKVRKPENKQAKQLEAVPAVSPKREAFVRLGEGRTAAAIQAIRLIGNLSNTALYEYTDDDVKLMLNSIREELAATEARFEAETHKRARKPIKLQLQAA